MGDRAGMGMRAAAIVFSCAAVPAVSACLASTQPSTSPAAIAQVATALGARSNGDACGHSRAELVDLTLAEWRARPNSAAYDPEWACVALADDLSRDSMGACVPAPLAVFDRPISFFRRVTGEMFYVGLDPREYAYDLTPDPAGVGVEVRVQLTGPLARDPARVASMQAKMDRAADLWTANSPDRSMHFRFRAVTSDASFPHFQVRLYEGEGRTPFDVSWAEAWPWHLLAHEIGHMLGLDDEYGQLAKTWGHAIGEDAVWDHDPSDKVRWFGCSPTSLMCDSRGQGSTPQRYHYYAILRRRFCRVTPPDGDVLAP